MKFKEIIRLSVGLIALGITAFFGSTIGHSFITSERFGKMVKELLDLAHTNVVYVPDCKYSKLNDGKLIFAQNCPVSNLDKLTPFKSEVFDFLKDAMEPVEALCVTEIARSFSAAKIPQDKVDTDSLEYFNKDQYYGYFKDVPSDWRQKKLDHISIDAKFGDFTIPPELIRFACASIASHKPSYFTVKVHLETKEPEPAEPSCTNFFTTLKTMYNNRVLVLKRVSDTSINLPKIYNEIYTDETHSPIKIADDRYCLNDLQLQSYSSIVTSAHILGKQESNGNISRWSPFEKVEQIKGLNTIASIEDSLEKILNDSSKHLDKQISHSRENIILNLIAFIIALSLCFRLFANKNTTKKYIKSIGLSLIVSFIISSSLISYVNYNQYKTYAITIISINLIILLINIHYKTYSFFAIRYSNDISNNVNNNEGNDSKVDNKIENKNQEVDEVKTPTLKKNE